MENLIENKEKLLKYDAVDEDEDTLINKYLTFKISDEYYAIEIKYVTEIIGMQKITKLPNIKKFINGIINLRGIIIPVVEVRTRFGLNLISYNEKTCIIVVNLNETTIGLIVDEVSEVIIINPENISNPPATNKGTNSKFIQSIGTIENDVKMIININKILYDDLQVIE